MSSTTEGLYIPEALINGYRDMIQAGVPTDIQVTVSQTELPASAVNLWPSSPTIESLALAGAMRARIRIQATSLDTTINGARAIGSRVRMLIAGRGPRGGLITVPAVAGYKIIDVVSSEGRGDNVQGLGQWTEVFEVLYDCQAPAIAQS